MHSDETAANRYNANLDNGGPVTDLLLYCCMLALDLYLFVTPLNAFKESRLDPQPGPLLAMLARPVRLGTAGRGRPAVPPSPKCLYRAYPWPSAFSYS